MTRPRWGIVLFVLALAPRATWVLYRWAQSGPPPAYPDEQLHWELAWNLVHHGALVTDDGRFAARMPVYPLFLALFAWIGPAGMLAARLAQAVLAALTAWCAYQFATAALDRRAGIVAGALLALDPFNVFFCNLLLTETLFTFLAIALTACAWRVLTPASDDEYCDREDHRRATSATGGGRCGKTSGAEPGRYGKASGAEPGRYGKASGAEPGRYGKTSGAGGGRYGKTSGAEPGRYGKTSGAEPGRYGRTSATGGGRCGKTSGAEPGRYDGGRTRSTRVARWGVAGVALLGPAALMTRPSAAGWVVLLWVVLWLLDARKKLAARRVQVYLLVLAIPMLAWALRNRAVLGHPSWLSANGGVTLYDAQGPQADGSSNQQFLSELPGLATLNEIDRDAALRDLAIEHMRRDPARVLRLAWTKFLRTWSLFPNVDEYRRGLIAWVSATYTACVLVLAFVGVWRARRNRAWLVLVWLPVVYFTLLHCVFVGSVRYRVPLMPFVALSAAAAFSRTLDRKKDSSGNSGKCEPANQPRSGERP